MSVYVLNENREPIEASPIAWDDARRKGKNLEHENTTPPEQIELYTGRGGARLLTLADALRARRVVQGKP